MKKIYLPPSEEERKRISDKWQSALMEAKNHTTPNSSFIAKKGG